MATRTSGTTGLWVTPVKDSELTDKGKRLAAEGHDVRIP